MTENFTRDALHVLLLDDLRSDPLDVYSNVCRFLGIADSVPPISDVVNSYVRFRSPRFRAMYIRWPKVLADAAGRLNRVVDRYPAIEPATRALLSEHYRDRNAELEAWVDRHLPWD